MEPERDVPDSCKDVVDASSQAATADIQTRAQRSARKNLDALPADVRDSLVQKLIHAIFPIPKSEWNSKMSSLEKYARKVEEDIFNGPGMCKLQHFAMLHHLIFQAEEDLKKIRQKRIEQVEQRLRLNEELLQWPLPEAQQQLHREKSSPATFILSYDTYPNSDRTLQTVKKNGNKSTRLMLAVTAKR